MSLPEKCHFLDVSPWKGNLSIGFSIRFPFWYWNWGGTIQNIFILSLCTWPRLVGLRQASSQLSSSLLTCSTFCPTEELHLGTYQCVVTCVNSGIEIPLSLQFKILKYKILWQLLMDVQDFFSLCKIFYPAWIQADWRNVEQIELCLSDLCITILKNTPLNVNLFPDRSLSGYSLNLVQIKID